MKNSLLLVLIASCLTACSIAKSSTSQVNDTTASSSPNSPAASPSVDPNAPSYTALSPADADAQKILGSYVGAFGDNKITMLITKAAGNSISGRTVVGGNDRPFDGTYTVQNNVYTVNAKEPGDNKYDGVFKFTVSSADPSKVTGTWKPNDTSRPEKSYTLDRRKFEYKPNVGQYPEASTRLLKAKDVENLDKGQLTFMRQEIFARHGYCFSKKEFRQQFENEDWYVPDTTDIRGRLTDIEKKNIALIQRYEKYADEYGDGYGR
ncbi:MAG: YARHG domain-containing protein [Acidobacteria bacterium]|nr:YARHG domain-containing protein [Acidobacteriota bacterium]